MKTIAEYIEELKDRYKLESYYKAMKYIGMEPQGWTKIKRGGGISEKNALRLAQALKINALEIISISNALKAENNELKTFWLKIAEEKEKERKENITTH
jgi:hypothetical protein